MNQARGSLMSVRSDLVREHLVEAILDAAMQRFPGEAPTPLSSAMGDALRLVVGPERAAAAPTETVGLAERLARIGYLSREVEVDTFEPARTPPAWLGGKLRGHLDEAKSRTLQEAAVAVSV
jgi:hypothetical protein